MIKLLVMLHSLHGELSILPMKDCPEQIVLRVKIGCGRELWNAFYPIDVKYLNGDDVEYSQMYFNEICDRLRAEIEVATKGI